METSLRNIKSAARALTNMTAPLVPVYPLPKSTSIKIPPLQLSSPPHLRPRLEGLAISSEAVSEITRAFDNAAAAVQKLCILKFEDSCRTIAMDAPTGSLPTPDFIEKLRCTFQATYERNLRFWSHELIPSYLIRCNLTRPTPKSTSTRRIAVTTKSPFNQDYVPLFEKYFEINPFPSHADKSLLAKKSAMSYRQIDVWFQNRRSRVKKDGKALKRLPSYEEPGVSLELLEELMGDRIIPEKERVDSVDSDASEYEWQYDTDEEDTSAWDTKYERNPDLPDFLNVASPPHAFPSAYPPSCGYNPFPVKEGQYTFPSPVWLRYPAKSTQRRPEIELDELIGDFNKLSVRDGPRRRLVKKDPRKPTDPKRTRAPPPRPDRSAATLFITTRPLPAPIPALIRSTIPVQVTPSSPFASLPPLTPKCASPSPTSASRRTTLSIPAPNSVPQEKHPRRRKLAPLPRRTPAGTGNSRRGGTLATPETTVLSPAPPPSHSSISRESSFGSEFSSQTRISSDSSSASSAVVTPESSTSPLPEYLSTPSIHDNLGYLHEFLSNPSSGRLSPVQGIRLSLPSVDGFHVGSEKQRFLFTFSASPHTSLGDVLS